MDRSQRHEDIMFVCAASWPEIRKQVVMLLGGGGLASLERGVTLLAEAEFRDRIPDSDELPDHVWARLRRMNHPLGWLPPRRAAVEHGLSVWNYSPDGTGGRSMPAPGPVRGLEHGPPAEHDGVEPSGDEAGAAFESITKRSNGRAEATAFRLKSPAKASLELIASIGRDFVPLKGAATGHIIGGADALHAVMDIAINGGAYDHGAGAALGRLGAWRTVRWLTTADPDSTFEEVCQLVDACTWVRLNTDSKWFDNVAWDGAFACLGADGRRLAVVAWTDTD
ncbi:MAG: DUF6183 family protein [Phycisphaerales bacterium]